MKSRNLDEIRERLPEGWSLDELILRLVAEHKGERELQVAYYPPDANEGTLLDGSDLSRVTVSLTVGPEHLYIMDMYNDGRLSFVERKDFDPLTEIYFMFRQGEFYVERLFQKYAQVDGYQDMSMADFKNKVDSEVFKPISELSEIIIRNENHIVEVINAIVDDELLKAFFEMEIRPRLIRLLK